MDIKKTRAPSGTTLLVLTLIVLATSPAAAASRSAAGDTWQGKARDAWIDGKIEASYAINRFLNPFEIDTRVEAGVVHLTGTVKSQIDKDLAGEIATGIDGVKSVRNDLVVDPGAADTASTPAEGRDLGMVFKDATTTARVKTALLLNESTQGLRIDVDTFKGTVSLKGSVGSAQERELAARLAENTEGVDAVQNELTVSKDS